MATAFSGTIAVSSLLRNERANIHVDAIQCLTQDDTEQNVPLKYADEGESRYICLECYEASKQLPGMIQKLASATVYLT